MKTIELINSKNEEHGKKVLNSYYEKEIIPPEKKEYPYRLKEIYWPIHGRKKSG